jgi:hypothetical protein
LRPCGLATGEAAWHATEASGESPDRMCVGALGNSKEPPKQERAAPVDWKTLA